LPHPQRNEPVAAHEAAVVRARNVLLAIAVPLLALVWALALTHTG